MSSSDREQSPTPDSPVAPNHLRTTRASQERVSEKRPGDVLFPATVSELAKLSPMDRIKREYQQKQEKTSKRPTSGFGSNQSRSLTPDAPSSPQAKRRTDSFIQVMTERAALLAKRDAKYAPPADPRSVKHASASWWSKSKLSGDRHQFQRVWPARGFPSAAVQSCMTPASPGPGAYGDSISFVKA
jgi:hypothetical protein